MQSRRECFGIENNFTSLARTELNFLRRLPLPWPLYRLRSYVLMFMKLGSRMLVEISCDPESKPCHNAIQISRLHVWDVHSDLLENTLFLLNDGREIFNKVRIWKFLSYMTYRVIGIGLREK
jgi:hypothetical protein